MMNEYYVVIKFNRTKERHVDSLLVTSWHRKILQGAQLVSRIAMSTVIPPD